MKALVINPDGTSREADLSESDTARLTELQALVHGYIEPLSGPTWTAWVNEDGADRALPANPRATALVRGLGSRASIRPAGLLGTVVLLGLDRGRGVECDVPAEVTAAWLEAAQ
jgi:hypothetical protein